MSAVGEGIEQRLAAAEPNPQRQTARGAHVVRGDFRLIADMIEGGSRVLDVGCSDGALLEYLAREHGIVGRGMELSQAGVNASVSRGLSVVQGNADTDLVDYPDGAFDYVVLSQTLQATHDPRKVMEQLVRIGHHAIVSFPNFGYWRVRLRLLFAGRMPVTPSLPDHWYETQNIHLCTILDFVELCQRCGIEIERALILGDGEEAREINNLWRANWLGRNGMFLLRRSHQPGPG